MNGELHWSVVLWDCCSSSDSGVTRLLASWPTASCCVRVSLLSFQSGTSCDQWDSRVTAAEYLQQVCVAVTFTPFQTSVVVDSCGGYTRQLSDAYL